MSPKQFLRNIARQAGGVKEAARKRVVVAMSGGVDSSVATLLLKERNYDVIGIFMRCYNLDGCAERDAEDARRVAEKIGIPFYVWDFEEEYKKRVVDYMIDGYRQGITPNPDVMCNKEIKFGLFLRRALEMGADYVATGHYVKLAKSKEQRAKSRRKPFAISYLLFAARDANKDQSYFLWTLTQEQLKHCLFPIGDYLKSEVREIARKAGLPTADKKDSQGICFLGKVTLADFLKEYIPEKRGEVLLASKEAERTISYKKIGEHSGANFYTIGQRHIGVAVGKWQMANGKSKPVYVAEKDIEQNVVVVAEGADNPELYKKEVNLANVNFINQEHSNILQNIGMLKVMARVRYRQPLAPATLALETRNEIGINQLNQHKSAYQIIFDEPIKFVAPGQSAVFYSSENELLGGGVIL